MPDPTTEQTTATPLAPEREQEIRETDPGSWYRAPWTTDFVDGNGEADDPSYWRVISEGETIATLPDFAGGLALFIADAREAVPELLAEVTRLRAELNQAHDDRTGACLARWEEEQDNARLRLALASAQRGRREARNRTKGEGPDREAES